MSLALLMAALVKASGAQEDTLASPNQNIEVSIRMPKAGSNEKPTWSARFHHTSILTGCSLGLQAKDGGELVTGAHVVRQSSRANDERIQVLFGRADHAQDSFRETRYSLESASHCLVDIVFRCYNDAIAFRYEIPNQEKISQVVIVNESTAFRFERNPTAYVQYLENYKTSHEHNVITVPFREIQPNTLLDTPLTLSWDDKMYAAVTEASLRHYAGMSLRRISAGDANDELVSDLTPRPDGTRVAGPLPFKTPWRVILLADHPGALLESETIYCLNEPGKIQDLSWIHPGKITFPWWNGDVYDGKPSLPILSFEMARKYIDFCAEHGIPTHSMTSTETSITPWYVQSKPGVEPGPDTDVTRPRDGFDLAGIKQYADSKHIRLWTWVHQGALRGRVEEAFTAFEKLGWSGMMVDFFDHDDQDSIEFAESILDAAARHHILIHFHGVWKPTGWQRTYPNLMNHEGALNLEYLKWSDRCTPEHDLMMAFTRLVAGPMDYHLGGFRALPRAEFKPITIAPSVLGTRCRMLAMYVCFDNPNPMVADYPTAYEDQPGFDFVVQVPTWWDETRVLEGQIGELLVTARRKGTTWYLGGMSAKKPHELSLPLSFLGQGSYSAKLWKDTPDADSKPNQVAVETVNLSRNGALKLRLETDGGFVAQIKLAGNEK